MREPRHPAPEEIELTGVFHALSDPIRWSIVRALSGGAEVGCARIGAGMPKATLSHHLKVLREAGLTRTRVEGVRRYVSLRRRELNRRFPGLLDALLKQK